jgi:hypothetical protein
MAIAVATALEMGALVDARPVIPRNQSNLWTRAEQVRDAVYEQFARACKRDQLDPLLLASPPAVFPAWVKFEAWQPRDDRATTERSSALITIEPKPYHSHEFEFEVTYTRGTRSRTLKRVMPLSDEEVQALIAHLVHDRSKPVLRRFRQAPLQLWRRNNKIEGLRPDWLMMGMMGAFVGGFLLLVLLPAALVLWAFGVFLLLLLRRRKWIARVDGKPETEPRALVRVDSWQTVLFDVGNEQATLRERFIRSLEGNLAERCTFRPEHLWYWGLDGKEEREQLVLSAGRGLVFCQIYQYGHDLYVGWDGHLNRGQWVEQTVASGIDKESGNPISINRVVPGTQPISEYDLTDLSCLMEWTHAQIVKVLRQLIAEKKIDQEIDFKIQRGERQQVVAPGSAATSDNGLGGRMRSAFRRIA